MNEDISEKLFMQFHQCVNLMLRGHHAAHLENMPEMYRGQGRLLMILSKEDGLTNGEICERMNIRPSSVNDLVSKLENAGYVTKKERENKRQVGYYLTEAGQKVVKDFSQKRMPVMRETFSALTDEEQVDLNRLLEKLNASLKQKQDGRTQEDIYVEHKFAHEHFHPLHPHGGHARSRKGEFKERRNFQGAAGRCAECDGSRNCPGCPKKNR